MGITKIDGRQLKKAIIMGANELDKNKALIDSLNVFPVPDGDTGTNMSLTILAAAKEVEKLDTNNIYNIAKAASSGSLRGARGNSGVIVSQIFRGFAKGLEHKSAATADDLAYALGKAAETAYKAVMKPKEGTVLTMIKALSEKAEEMTFETDDISAIMSEVLKHGSSVLAHTKEMLPQLRQADVVDAGAKGLLCFLEAAVMSFRTNAAVVVSKPGEIKNLTMSAVASVTDKIEFAYCTEFFILSEISADKETGLKDYLGKIGDSVVVVCDDDLVKIHVHTNNPGEVLEKALAFGQIDNVKIENMKRQHTNSIAFQQTEPFEKKLAGFVAVSSGAGITEVFKCLGVDEAIEGGQSMNPSTEDILEAVKKVNAENVIILPNNKNIILAAQQAAQICEEKSIHVIPTTTIPQGMAAMVNYVPVNSLEDNLTAMGKALEAVKSGSVTFAVRDTVLDGIDIHEGDILCMEENKIKIVAGDVFTGAKELLDSMIEDNGEFINIFYGHETTKEQADMLYEYITEKHPECDVELEWGGQPLYYYIFSVE